MTERQLKLRAQTTDHRQRSERDLHNKKKKDQQRRDVSDIQGLLNVYWGSTEYEFTVPSQS